MAQHIWPIFDIQEPWTAAVTAASILVSEKTIIGDLPPNSRDVCLRLLDANSPFFAVNVDQVKEILPTFRCSVKYLPVVEAIPEITLLKPLGKPASFIDLQT